MKTNYIIIHTLILLLALVGCTAETDMERNLEGAIEEGKQAQAVFNLAVPSMGTPSATRAITDDSEIKQYTVWVFDGKGDDATFKKQIKKGDENVVIREVNGVSQMFVLLPESESPVTLSLIVNSPDPAPSVGTSKDEALKNLTFSIATEQPNYMPMYGECELEKVKQGMLQSAISLRRAMAKIEVDIRDAYSQFVLQEVELLNINSAGYIAPSAGINKSEYTYKQTINATTKEDNIFTCYIPEVKVKGGLKRVSVLLKGVYQDDGEENYYRLDFITGKELTPDNNGEIENIVRNYKYIFSINNVSATGFSTRDDAINSLTPSNALSGSISGNLLVVEDEDIMDITTDGANYLGVTTAKITGGVNIQYYYANFSIICNNTTDGWKMKTDEFPKGVTVSLTSHKPTTTDMNMAVSVWIYIERILVKPGQTINVFVYCGSIRKKIEVIIPSDEVIIPQNKE